MQKIIKFLLSILVVVVLLVGIVTIFNRLKTGDKPGRTPAGDTSAASEVTTEAAKDNSIPMTKLEITAPANNMRVGEEMKLDIKYEPADATNATLEWTCSGGSSEDLVDVTEDGVLTPHEDAGKNTVTVTATATDGSGLSASFDLRIYPAIDPSKPMVAITFDDGPYPATTNLMIDALEENYAKATFFCLGQNAEYYPEVVKREYDLGLEVGTHTYAHKQLTTLDAEALESEINKAVEANKKAIGVAPELMRPPYGSADKTVLKAVGSHDLCCMNWSLDTEDWKTKNADDTYRMTMTAVDGDVILLHDIHEYNVEAVQRFVPDLIAQGIQLVTVSELYKNRGEELLPGTIHFRTDPTTEAKAETGPTSENTDADGTQNSGTAAEGSSEAAATTELDEFDE